MTLHLCLLGDASSVHLQRWAREMLARGLRVSVVTARPAPIAGVAEQVVLAPVTWSAQWLRRAGSARRALRRLAPDIVHAHYVTSYGYLGARSGCRPLVLTAWGSDLLVTPRRSALLRALTRWTLRRADLVTGDSADLVAAAAAYGLRAPPLRVHWGVDLARFAPLPWADKPRFEIVSLRNWEPNYRIEVVVQALAGLRARLPAGAPLHLHLLGGGPGAAALSRQVDALGLQGQVTLHGRLDDTGMAAVLARCKVSVSVPASDATSVSVLESMACGLAVVASDLPANREWLGADADLLLPQAGAAGLADALAAALAGLWHDDDRARRSGERNHRRMRDDGARSVQMDRMLAAYNALVAAVEVPLAAAPATPPDPAVAASSASSFGSASAAATASAAAPATSPATATATAFATASASASASAAAPAIAAAAATPSAPSSPAASASAPAPADPRR